MKSILSKSIVLFTGVVVSILFLPGAAAVATAEQGALEQLIGLLEKRGSISPLEARNIRSTIAREKKTLDRRVERLVEREKKLREREAWLGRREKALDQNGNGGNAGTSPPDEAETPGDQGVVKKAGKDDNPAVKAFPLEAVYDRGFWLRTRDRETFSLRLGGLLQTDYRYFSYDSNEDPDKNRFDIRRARLLLEGKALKRFSYKFQYEFQGAGSRRLLDAYADVRIQPWISARAGQFKTPFGLEQSSSDKDIPFAERSMGFLLTPLRDVGLMVHGSLCGHRVNYGLGLFNGDGVDDSVGGDEDAPGLMGRIVFTPFKDLGSALWAGLHVGGSFSYASVDRNNVNIRAMTSGMTTFFNVNSSAKFKVIRDADSETRYGAELSWNYGPLLAWGEYTSRSFSNVRTSSDEFNIGVRDTYGALLWMVTGERPSVMDGKIQPIVPKRNFLQGGWGALGLAFRYDTFDAGESAYQHLVNPGDSVSEATSYTMAINWYLSPCARVLIDATRTRFDRPLLIDRDPLTGEAIYARRENVFTGRFQFQF